jgi:hypothetical protein
MENGSKYKVGKTGGGRLSHFRSHPYPRRVSSASTATNNVSNEDDLAEFFINLATIMQKGFFPYQYMPSVLDFRNRLASVVEFASYLAVYMLCFFLLIRRIALSFPSSLNFSHMTMNIVVCNLK